MAIPLWMKKRYLGYLALLLFAIALQNSEIKYNLLGTNAGRAVTLLLVIAATAMDKVLGVLAVGVIVYFYGVYEGAVPSMKGMRRAAKKAMSQMKEDLEKANTQLAELQSQRSQVIQKDATLSKLEKDISMTQDRINQLTKDIAAEEVVAASSAATAATSAVKTANEGFSLFDAVKKAGAGVKKTVSKGMEGFDLVGAESSLKRGKQSNQVEVAPFMRTSQMVEPFDNAMFKNGHASF